MSAAALPSISVCIANYNGEAMLADCIESVVQQNVDAKLEVIIHDDASTDGSVAFLKQHYPQINLLESRENVGFCVANNRMVEQATGQYVLLLNNDAALLPGALQALLRGAQTYGDDAVLTLPQYDWESGALVDRGCYLDLELMPVPNLKPGSREVAMTIGACLWLLAKHWRALGGFPDWLDSIGEDVFLCGKARLLGGRVVALDESGYRHRQGASFGGNRVEAGRLSTRYRRRYLSERNRIAVLAVCTPTWLVWPWLALRLLALIAEGLALSAVQLSLQPWRKIYLAALCDVFHARRLLYQQRRELQAVRRSRLRDYLRGFTPVWRKLTLLRRYGMPQINF